MTAFNAVRFKVKPGRDQEFLEAHRKVERNWLGMLTPLPMPGRIRRSVKRCKAFSTGQPSSAMR